MTSSVEQAARSRDVAAGTQPPPLPPPPSGRPLRRWSAATLVFVAVIASFAATDVGVGPLIEGRAGAARLLRGFANPDLSPEFLAIVARAAIETMAIAIAGLALSCGIGLPLAVLIAANVDAPRWLRRTARTTGAVLRGIPELLWALVFVAAVGLGPAAGVFAIALHGSGLLAKLCSEQLEAVDPAPVEAVRLTGASRSATALLATIPQARTGLTSLVLYQWECNIRTATVVGFVGAGGIGQALDISLRLFRYDELSTLVLAVLLLILGVDALSRVVRRRLGAAA
jgi:phosphonate transport system permease protein